MATTLSPNINWPTFAYCNENPTNSFESMTRRLFTCHFLKNQQLPHTEHNTPGIEVAPILEPPHADGTPQRRISFQSKYFDQESVDYGKIQDSARKAVKYYAGKLDAIYLFCNKTITTTTKGIKLQKKFWQTPVSHYILFLMKICLISYLSIPISIIIISVLECLQLRFHYPHRFPMLQSME